MEKSNKIGVIIARFQVPDLHAGHKYLIHEVVEKHSRVLILLGVAPIKLSENDPLNFETRKLMVEEMINDNFDGTKEITILPIFDKKQSDELWSLDVDAIICDTYFVNNRGAILYGSKDSFIPHYKGMFETVEITTPYEGLNGTSFRLEATQRSLKSSDFRRGVIYAISDKYPFVYSCVDIAIFNTNQQLLLGRKPTDPIGKWRFIGGFVDPKDQSDFAAARREAYEEAGIVVEPYKYICSRLVDDWRYKKEKNCKIMTRLIEAEYVSGQIKAGDDIEEVKWFSLRNGSLTREDFVSEHQKLYERLMIEFNINMIKKK